MSQNSEPGHDERPPVFTSVRQRVGGHATVQIASTIHASGTLTHLGPDGKGTVDVGGREVSGAVIPSMRRLHLSEPETRIPHIDTEEPQSRDEDPSPC
jgi:hypothetical protein